MLKSFLYAVLKVYIQKVIGLRLVTFLYIESCIFYYTKSIQQEIH